MQPLVDLIHNVGPKEAVPCKSLIILTLEEVNMVRPCHHHLTWGPIWSDVISCQPKKVSCNVPDILGCCDYVEP